MELPQEKKAKEVQPHASSGAVKQDEAALPENVKGILAEPKLMAQFSDTQLFDILAQTSSKSFLIFAEHCGNHLDKLTPELFLRLVKEYSLLSDLETKKSLAVRYIG